MDFALIWTSVPRPCSTGHFRPLVTRQSCSKALAAAGEEKSSLALPSEGLSAQLMVTWEVVVVVKAVDFSPPELVVRV